MYPLTIATAAPDARLLSFEQEVRSVCGIVRVEQLSAQLMVWCFMQGGFVSVWHDANGSLNYTMHAFHRLMPHFRSEALGLQASLVALVPTLPRFSLEGSPSDTPLLTAPPLMWTSAIMSNGQVWRWRVPLPVAQTAIYRTHLSQDSASWERVPGWTPTPPLPAE